MFAQMYDSITASAQVVKVNIEVLSQNFPARTRKIQDKQYRQCTYNITLRLICFCITTVDMEKAICFTYSACVSIASVIQHAMCKHHITSSSAACLALPYFSTIYDNQEDFQNEVTENKMCVLIFSNTFVWNVSHSKKN